MSDDYDKEVKLTKMADVTSNLESEDSDAEKDRRRKRKPRCDDSEESDDSYGMTKHFIYLCYLTCIEIN